MPTYNLNTRPVVRLPRSKRLQQLGMGTASSSSSVNINITEAQGSETPTYTVATRDTSGLMSGAMVTQLDFLYNNTWTWAEVLACMDGADDPTQTVLVRTIGICERAFALTMHHRRDIILTDIFPDDARFPVDDTAKIATLEMYVTAGLGQLPGTLIQRVTTPHIINADGTMNGYVQAHASIYERAYHITNVGLPDGRFGWSVWAKVEEGGGGGGTTVDAYTKAESDSRYQPLGDYIKSTTAAATYATKKEIEGIARWLEPESMVDPETGEMTLGMSYRTQSGQNMSFTFPIAHRIVVDPDDEEWGTYYYYGIMGADMVKQFYKHDDDISSIKRTIDRGGFSALFKVQGELSAVPGRIITTIPTGSTSDGILFCTANGKLYAQISHTTSGVWGQKVIDGYLEQWAASVDTYNAMSSADYYRVGNCVVIHDRIYKYRGSFFLPLLESTEVPETSGSPFIGASIYYENSDASLHIVSDKSLDDGTIDVKLYHYTRNNSCDGYRYGGWKYLGNMVRLSIEAESSPSAGPYKYKVYPVGYDTFSAYETELPHREGYSKPTMKKKMAIVITKGGDIVSQFLKFRLVPTQFANDISKEPEERYKLSRW